MSLSEQLASAGVDIVKTEELLKDDPGYKEVMKSNTIGKPISLAPKPGTRAAAIRAGLIPASFKDMDFDIAKVEANQRAQISRSSRKFKVMKFSEYKDITLSILSTISSNMLPNQSYIIGAPNGFGKTSFVNTCILKLYEQGRMCAPYISLTDLGNLRLLNEKRILSGIVPSRYYNRDNSELDAVVGVDYDNKMYDSFECKEYEKRPINVTDRYSWSEYMACDVLFCFFTDVGAKILESETLKIILTTRGNKGLPTIATIATSLDPYKNNKELAEFVWNEILYYGESVSYDRVKHISCYKTYKSTLEMLGVRHD